MHTAQSVREAIDLAKRGSQSMVKCPVHDDGEASLHVSPGRDQPVVMKCHAGCRNEDILDAEAIDPKEIMAEREDDTRVPDGENVWTPKGNASAVYRYVDEEGELLFETLRVPIRKVKDGVETLGKTFFQRTPNPTPNARQPYLWTLEGVRRVLYRLPEVLHAKQAGLTLWIVEGEKDVETLRRVGEYATSSPMGAGKWQDSFTDTIGEMNVNIVADKDDTGRAHARKIRDDLRANGAYVNVYEAADGCKDITDHIEAGHGFDELLLVDEETKDSTSQGVDFTAVIERSFEEKRMHVPNLLAEGDRLIITGFEGHGKSTLIRQWAVMMAAGIHPVRLTSMEPLRVLLADSENEPNQVLESWQQLAGLAARHGQPVRKGQLTILEEWNRDIDLVSGPGREWLLERVRAYRPDVMCIGPLYTLSGKDLRDDETVRKIAKVVNEARGICGTAFIMEHHAPHRNPNDKKRSVRPYGSSTFLKFPEFGYGLNPMDDKQGVYEWEKWRMPRVRSREFPEHMRWGKPNTDEWPWMPTFLDEQGNVVA